MKLQIKTTSQILSTCSALAVVVATNWEQIAPVLNTAKTAPFFVQHPHILAGISGIAVIVMLTGRSILSHRSGVEVKDNANN